jgi:hypothetical protein
MASTLSWSSSPMLSSHKAMPSIKANKVPCSAAFPIPKNFGINRTSRLSLVRAQGAGDNKDTSVDVPVIQGNQVPTEERRPSPRRLAVDNISPFGKSYTICLSLVFFATPESCDLYENVMSVLLFSLWIIN